VNVRFRQQQGSVRAGGAGPSSGGLGQLFLDRTFAYWKDLNEKIEKLTPGQVDVAAKQFIDPTKLSKVRAGDLAKKMRP
jgi:predicted Zn-dependent peptidase